MTIIVKHRRTSNQYVLLGMNGEVGKANPSRMISDFFNQEKSEISCSATVCDAQGNIFLADINDLIVTEIDGQKLAEILPEDNYEPVNNNVYSEQSEDFEDEDLEDEDFEQELDADASDQPQTSFIYGQGSAAQSNVSDDEEDWI